MGPRIFLSFFVLALGVGIPYLLFAWRKRMALKTFEPLPAGAKPVVSIQLENDAVIKLELYPDVAPNHCASMVDLIKKGYYDGLSFHRVVPGFVVQGGCPKGNGSGGPGYTVKAEFNERPHLTGTLAMARTPDPDSAGSQFYICLAPQPGLDREYTVFGQTLDDGMEHVSRIRQGDKMVKVTVEGV
jgi:peptidylprolyl isomerase/peptidyl-prolyl cis-trans isomerase B (cyclophilin B)